MDDIDDDDVQIEGHQFGEDLEGRAFYKEFSFNGLIVKLYDCIKVSIVSYLKSH